MKNKRLRFATLLLALLLLSLLFQDQLAGARSGGYSLYIPFTGWISFWQEVGPGSASGDGISGTGDSFSPSIGIAPDGTPYVTWEDESSGDWQIYVRRWSGRAWVEVGAGSASGGGISQGSSAGSPDIAVAPDGTPYITWSTYFEIFVRRWDGSSWAEVGVGSASGGGISNTPGYSLNPSIAIAPDGSPYIAWSDSSGGIYLRRWDGASWVEVGAGSASGGGISNTPPFSNYPSIAIAADGTPYVAWAQTNNNTKQIYVRRWNGNVWEEVGAGSASGGGISNTNTDSDDPEIVIGLDGKPYVAWTSQEEPPLTSLCIYIRRWNGVNWVQVGAGSASGGGITQGFGNAENAAIAIGPEGAPYVAWTQADNYWQTPDIRVRRWVGGIWEEAGAGSASGGGISSTGQAFEPAIAIDGDGSVYIAWTNGYYPIFEIYVRRFSQ